MRLTSDAPGRMLTSDRQEIECSAGENDRHGDWGEYSANFACFRPINSSISTRKQSRIAFREFQGDREGLELCESKPPDTPTIELVSTTLFIRVFRGSRCFVANARSAMNDQTRISRIAAQGGAVFQG